MCATITYLEYLDVHYKSRINYWLKLSQAKLRQGDKVPQEWRDQWWKERGHRFSSRMRR